ncbi:hypothetical protein LAV72_08135 [Lysinibacillus xylanilyticus]|uniref:hypothetical protein n=1 Tax=Lysinibacillus TaxID=400634 RepID=UPI002B241BE8|nr:hypothetical protein [Lysinibacillus xylanilyticus]MEB2299592.1 hypothetical protein [Lysinibacillus xylanilyticus]
MKNETITNELIGIIKQLSTENQQYFLTLVRMAAVAENAIKKHAHLDQTTQKSAR